jgi:hypothetical protein
MFTGKDFIYNPADFEDKWEKVDNRKKKTPVNFSESKITLVQEPIKNKNIEDKKKKGSFNFRMKRQKYINNYKINQTWEKLGDKIENNRKNSFQSEFSYYSDYNSTISNSSHDTNNHSYTPEKENIQQFEYKEDKEEKEEKEDKEIDDEIKGESIIPYNYKPPNLYLDPLLNLSTAMSQLNLKMYYRY